MHAHFVILSVKILMATNAKTEMLEKTWFYFNNNFQKLRNNFWALAIIEFWTLCIS